jgi:hypothetical protein
MLWLKGWYETRLRLLLVAVATLAICLSGAGSDTPNGEPPAQDLEVATLFGAAVMAAIMLAGAGIKTQPGGFRPSKGLHGSMYYTLSLPVTRRRLFTVRVLLGIAETAAVHVLACCAVWTMRPAVRLHFLPADMMEHAVAAFACVAVVYAAGVFFAIFLDDLYQTWATMAAVMAGIVFLNRVSLPAVMQPFLLLSRASPLITHTMPWLGMTTFLVFAALLLMIALKIVESREY